MAKSKKQKVELEINPAEVVQEVLGATTQVEQEPAISKSEELTLEKRVDTTEKQELEVVLEEVSIPEEVKSMVEELENIVKKPEPVQQQGRKIGKINVTQTFLNSNTIFFTWLHKQGYAIIDRKFYDHNQTMDFVLEGGDLSLVTDGSIPEYNVHVAGSRLSITKK